MKSFWDQHEEAELKLVKQERLPQDAPAPCSFCPHFGPDVIIGVCEACSTSNAPNAA